MANTRREIVKDLLATGISRREANAQATKILATQGDVVVSDKNGNVRPVDPGPSIFDNPE
jgi:hypothetical protein